MTPRELGQHRDAHLTLDELLRKGGPILETAVQSAIKIHAPFFTQVGPDLRHRLTGETIEEWVKQRRITNPNDYADYEPVTEEQVMHETIENACLRPSPASLGKLYKLVGELRYNELLKQWGTDAARMLPGQRPGYAEHAAKKDGDASGGTSLSSNPWSDKWHGTPAEALAEQTRIIRTGTKIAQNMAKAAGVSVLGAKLR